FAGATSVLRYLVGIDQMPADTPLEARLANELSYLAVVAVAIAGLSQLRRTQAQLELLATHDPLTNVLNARAFSTELAQELGRHPHGVPRHAVRDGQHRRRVRDGERGRHR